MTDDVKKLEEAIIYVEEGCATDGDYHMVIEAAKRDLSRMKDDVGGDGYTKAFYEIADILKIGARPYSPKDAFERDVKPILRHLMTLRQPPAADKCPNCEAMEINLQSVLKRDEKNAADNRGVEVEHLKSRIGNLRYSTEEIIANADTKTGAGITAGYNRAIHDVLGLLDRTTPEDAKGDYCQPIDYKGRQWILYFEDADVPMQSFGDDESAARKAYVNALLNWSCILFCTATQQPEHETGDSAAISDALGKV